MEVSDEATKGDLMSTSAAAHQGADLGEELSRWLVGAGIITVALFPLAIPALVLTAVLAAPLVVLGFGAALPAGIVAGIVLGIRAMRRRLGSRPGGWSESPTVINGWPPATAPRANAGGQTDHRRAHSPLPRRQGRRPSGPRLTRQIGR
jgi:hypothetical protein